jgi:hypothetical protein
MRHVHGTRLRSMTFCAVHGTEGVIDVIVVVEGELEQVRLCDWTGKMGVIGALVRLRVRIRQPDQSETFLPLIPRTSQYIDSSGLLDPTRRSSSKQIPKSPVSQKKKRASESPCRRPRTRPSLHHPGPSLCKNSASRHARKDDHTPQSQQRAGSTQERGRGEDQRRA